MCTGDTTAMVSFKFAVHLGCTMHLVIFWREPALNWPIPTHLQYLAAATVGSRQYALSRSGINEI